MTISKTRSKKSVFILIVICLSFFLPLAATAISYSITKKDIEEKNKQRFENSAKSQEKAILSRADGYIDVLRGASGLFLASEDVTSDEFRIYSESVNPKESIPGALGLGYIAEVQESEIEEYVLEQQRSGNTNFQIKPDQSGENGFYVITYIEPRADNEAAVGLNIAFEENRRRSANISKASGEPRITKSIELVQDAKKSAGFLILLPIYDTNMPIATEQQRLQAFQGWVYNPLLADDFFETLSTTTGFSDIDIQVEEVLRDGSTKKIYSDIDRPVSDAKFSDESDLEFLGQKWKLTSVSSKSFENGIDYGQANILLYGGLIFSLLSLSLGFVIFKRSEFVEKEVRIKTKELSESEDRFSRVVKAANTGIWDWKDPNSDEVYWSPQFYNLLGYEDGEIKPSSKFFTTEVVHPDDLEASIKAYENSVENGGRYEAEYRLRTKSGEYRWFQAYGLVTFNPETNSQRVSGSITDITDLRNTQEALRVSQERLSLAIEGSNIGLFDLADVSKDEGYLSPQTYYLLGYSDTELEAKASALVNLVEPSQREFAVSQVLNAIKEMNSFVFECQMKRKDGTYIWIEAKGAVTTNTETGKKRITGSFIDISGRKEVEKLKNEFVSTVSHELRTPLTSIRGSLGLLTGAMLNDLPSEAQELVEIANRNSERLGVLINDILDIEKLTSGKLEFFVDSIKVAPLISKCVESIESYAKIHNINLRLQPIDEDIKIDADPDRLTQVLHNLLSNAIKYSGENETVNVYVRRSEDNIRICVEDNGIGVPEEFRSKIFSQFSQSDSSSTRAQGGSGLGLYISQKFMDRMKGSIGFDPKESGGTIFWLEFKVSKGIEHKRVKVDSSTKGNQG